MRPALSESQAMRREWMAGGLAFVSALTAATAAIAYFLAVHYLPSNGWVDTLALGARLLMLAVLIGLGATWLAVAIVQRRHFALGVYRCWRCNRALPDAKLPCVCWPREQRVERRARKRMRHYRRALRPVILTYLALIGPTLLFAYLAPRPNITPADVAFLHGLLCLLVGIGIELANCVLEFIHRGRRFRLRSAVFIRVLAGWPLVMCVAALVCHAFGYDPMNR